MTRAAFIIILGFFITACSANRNIVFTDTESNTGKPSYLANELKTDDYPSFMVGEGNIYSCRYGISFISSDEFVPPKDQIFSALLKRNLPNIETHKVALERFDVYYNRRLRTLSAATAGIIGGAIGGAISASIDSNNYGFTYKNLLVDVIPETYPINTDENAVGCDGENEGEYYTSRVTAGHDVIVTWLKFRVDGVPYHFRTLYQIQPEKPDDVSKGIMGAIQKSIAAISSKIKV